MLLFITMSVIGQLRYRDENIWATLTYDSLSNNFCLKIENCSRKDMYLNKKKSPFTRGACFLLIGHESMPIGPQSGQRLNFLKIPPFSTDSLVFKDTTLQSFQKQGISVIEAIISIDYILLPKIRTIKDGYLYDFFKKKIYKIRQFEVTGYMTF